MQTVSLQWPSASTELHLCFDLTKVIHSVTLWFCLTAITASKTPLSESQVNKLAPFKWNPICDRNPTLQSHAHISLPTLQSYSLMPFPTLHTHALSSHPTLQSYALMSPRCCKAISLCHPTLQSYALMSHPKPQSHAHIYFIDTSPKAILILVFMVFIITVFIRSYKHHFHIYVPLLKATRQRDLWLKTFPLGCRLQYTLPDLAPA